LLAIMKMRYIYLFVFIIFTMQVSASDEDVFDVTISNDNLIVCILVPSPTDAQYLELKLKGGRKIRITPMKTNSCNSMFYLDSQQAQLVKKKGIRSIIFYNAGDQEKVNINESQNKQFLSSLP